MDLIEVYPTGHVLDKGNPSHSFRVSAESGTRGHKSVGQKHFVTQSSNAWTSRPGDLVQGMTRRS